MRFSATKIPGAFIVEPDEQIDERGFFARVHCRKEFASRGLNPELAQCSISFNTKRGTLRGLHYQVKPHEEAKLVRCTQGGVFDVVADLRPGSSTFAEWYGTELTAENRRMLYVPEGCGHGFVTLRDETEVHYYISEFHHQECARGVRWDDPALAVRWPITPTVVSAADRSYPDLRKDLMEGSTR